MNTEIDLLVLDDLAKIAKSLPVPKLKGRLRVLKDNGMVVVADDNDTIVLFTSEEQWNKLGIEVQACG